jgi:hypothetical protein
VSHQEHRDACEDPSGDAIAMQGALPANDGGTWGPQARAASAAARIGRSLLPHALLRWAMFVGRRPRRDQVMLALAFAALVSSTVRLLETLELHFSARAARAGLRTPKPFR